jgi:hypothetical protein
MGSGAGAGRGYEAMCRDEALKSRERFFDRRRGLINRTYVSRFALIVVNQLPTTRER